MNDDLKQSEHKQRKVGIYDRPESPLLGLGSLTPVNLALIAAAVIAILFIIYYLFQG